MESVRCPPPLIACIVSEGDYSFAALRATGECVVVQRERVAAHGVELLRRAKL
jgi:hypothetical protein